jgi:hypothetical protein
MSSARLRTVELSNDYCTLRFKTDQPMGEPIDFSQLHPCRTVITRSKRTFRGKAPDQRNDRMQQGESRNEVRALPVLVASAHADVLRVQPFELIYEDGAKPSRYFPDILLAWSNEIWIVEIKPDQKADRADEIARFARIEQLFATHRMHFRVWKKSSICAEPRFSNCRKVLRYQRSEFSPFDRERLRRLFTTRRRL